MPSAPFHILLVEDDPGDAELTRLGLTQSGSDIDLFVVDRGQTALNYLQQTGQYRDVPRPHLILLDLNLPGLNGREVLSAIERLPGLKSIPTIVFSTSASQSDIQEVYALGANSYVTKPSQLQQFLQKIAQVTHYWLSVVELSESA